jgi:predicted nucleic acid-binding protein
LVFTEAADGDPDAASRWMQYLADVEQVPITVEARSLARALLEEGALPHKAVADALHVATAAVHGIKYLLTWNCAHLANAEIRPLVRSVCAVHGYTSPEICTPEELMGEEADE